ncbi:hypothetical protein D9M68_898920 [compost metagenome]
MTLETEPPPPDGAAQATEPDTMVSTWPSAPFARRAGAPLAPPTIRSPLVVMGLLMPPPENTAQAEPVYL